MTYAHPLDANAITEENYHEVATELRNCQMRALRDQLDSDLLYGISDDETDYLTTALDATKTLMDIAYDGNREDLIHFLFTPRSVYELMPPHTLLHEPLHYIDSAGGLCDELQTYATLLYDQERDYA